MQIQVEHGAIEFGVVNRSLRRRDRQHRSDDIGSSSFKFPPDVISYIILILDYEHLYAAQW
jgi:hypothetical protein